MKSSPFKKDWITFLVLIFSQLIPIYAQEIIPSQTNQNDPTSLNPTSLTTIQPEADNRFIRAVQLNRAYHVKRLLDTGHHPNTIDTQGNPMLTMALYEDAFDVVWILMQHPQININQTNQQHETPLMLACLKGQFKIVKQMVEKYQAQINHSGWTPLHYAASTGQIDIAQFLIEHHAIVNTLSPNGTTPLMMATRGGHVHTVKLLLDAGADVFIKNELGLNAADIADRYHHQTIASGLRSRMKKLNALQKEEDF